MARARVRIVALGVAAACAIAAAGLARAVEDAGDDAKAKAAMEKARADGARLWTDKAIGENDKNCAGCHENPKRPDLLLKGVHERFPRWDRAAGRVITLQEKFVQMHERNLKAKKPFPVGDERWTALEVHLRSLK